MKFTVFAAAAAFASLGSALDCSESERFGGFTITPNTLKVGESFTLHNNLTCAPVKGIHPRFIDYFLEVPLDLNNGHQPAIYLRRSTFNISNPPDADIFVGKIPFSPTITSFPNSTSYVISSTVLYPVDFTDANSPLIAGGVSSGLTVLSS